MYTVPVIFFKWPPPKLHILFTLEIKKESMQYTTKYSVIGFLEYPYSIRLEHSAIRPTLYLSPFAENKTKQKGLARDEITRPRIGLYGTSEYGIELMKE